MDRWRPGDLSPSGIMLTLAYLVLAYACHVLAGGWRMGRPTGRDGRIRTRHRRWVWGALAMGMLLIAIERQLGLLDLITDALRSRAVQEGAYGARRYFQASAIRKLAIGAAAAGITLTALAGLAGWRAAAATVTTTGIVAYLILKSISLHSIDHALSQHIAGVAAGNLIELGLAAAAMAIVALEYAHRRASRSYWR